MGGAVCGGASGHLGHVPGREVPGIVAEVAEGNVGGGEGDGVAAVAAVEGGADGEVQAGILEGLKERGEATVDGFAEERLALLGPGHVRGVVGGWRVIEVLGKVGEQPGGKEGTELVTLRGRAEGLEDVRAGAVAVEGGDELEVGQAMVREVNLPPVGVETVTFPVASDKARCSAVPGDPGPEAGRHRGRL